ncbi:TraC family protein [Vibrio splendidus]
MFKFKFHENEGRRLFRPLAHEPVNDLFINDDKTLGISFVCNPASGWDTQMISTIALMLSQDSYPTNAMMSFSLWSNPDIKQQLKGSDYLRRSCKNQLMKDSHDTALGFMWGGTKKPIEVIQNTKVRNFQLIVSLKFPVDSIDVTEDEMERMVAIQRVMEQRLIKAHLAPQRMSAVMLSNLMNPIMHWQNDAEWRNKQELPVEEDKTLNEQFLQFGTSVKEKRDGVVIRSSGKDTFVKMLTVRRFPRKTRVGAAFKWFGDPFDGLGCVTQNFLITINIVFPEHTKIKATVESKRTHYIRSSFSALTHFAPKIKEMKADLDELSDSLEKDGRGIRVMLSAAVFGETEQEADDGLTSLQTFMKQSGTTMVKEDTFAIPSFIQLLPLGACLDAVKTSLRYSTMSTKHVLPILPIFAEWKGTGTPMMQFISRTGQIMNIDLYDSKTNFNTLIYAESGSGKSFLVNEIIRSYLSTNNKVWAIDAGESYKKLSQSFDGEFTAFGGQSDLSCNPFTMISEDDPEAFKDSLEMLGGCIMAMAFTKQSPTDLQATEIERILGEVWEKKGNKALIDDVANECIRQGGELNDQRIADIGRQLYAFTTKGQFGKYFNKPHNIEFNGNFNVLELDGLSKTPRLQAVILFMLMIQISHSMYEEFKLDRNVKRVVIIDEAWDLLGNSKAVEQFMEKGFRRFRKYGGAGVIVTQSINDLQKSAAGKAIAENAANSLILKQKDSTIASAEKDDLMSLPKAGYRLLKKVTTEAGHYSEIFFNTNSGMGIGRLIVDPLRVVMYSTRAQDNAKIELYTNNGTHLSKAMQNVVRDDHMARFEMKKPEFLRENVAIMDTNLDADLLEMPMDYIGKNTANTVEFNEQPKPQLKAAND